MTRSRVIERAHGNLLQADVDALVNTVNTEGVMGKGIALQFKRAFPAMFRDYAQAAKRHELSLGRMHVWPTGQLAGPRFIINFPTKGHWKAASRLADIERGLDDLVRVIRREGIRSIAVPPLGCGNGGLDWTVIEPLIRTKLAPLDDIEVLLYPPEGAPAASMPTGEPRPAMTPGRAALLRLLAQYSRQALGDASLVEAQKLAYFLQVAGEPLRLEFVGHYYGPPYADGLRHVLATIEGHYISGFGDGSALVEQAEPLRLLPGAEDAAAAELADRPETATYLARVLELIEGFETPYGLELLATVHWVLQHQPADEAAVVEAVRAWSPRKGRMFTPEHIVTALTALRDRGWSPALAAAH